MKHVALCCMKALKLLQQAIRWAMKALHNLVVNTAGCLVRPPLPTSTGLNRISHWQRYPVNSANIPAPFRVKTCSMTIQRVQYAI